LSIISPPGDYHPPGLQNKALDLLADWVVSGTLVAHSGYPFTAIDGTSTTVLGSNNHGPAPGLGLSIFANSPVGALYCSSSNVFHNYLTTPACRTTSEFSSPMVPGGAGTFGNERRNQIYGPGYFDTDLTLMKSFRIPKWGAQSCRLALKPSTF